MIPKKSPNKSGLAAQVVLTGWRERKIMRQPLTTYPLPLTPDVFTLKLVIQLNIKMKNKKNMPIGTNVHPNVTLMIFVINTLAIKMKKKNKNVHPCGSLHHSLSMYYKNCNSATLQKNVTPGVCIMSNSYRNPVPDLKSPIHQILTFASLS